MKRPCIAILHFASVLASVATVACGNGPEEARVRLRLRYEVGDTLHYAYNATGTVTHTDSVAPAGTIAEPYERRIRIDEVATEMTPRGNFLLAWTYHLPPHSEDTEDTKVSGMEVPMEFTVNVEITPQGRIVDVGNVETAKPLFGDLDFRTYLEQTQPVFPDRPLKVGDSWTQEVRVLSPEAEPVVTSSTYVLESLGEEEGEPIAVVAFDGDVYLPVVYEAGGDGGEGLRSVEERVAVRGKMYFAHERGIVRRVQSSAEATLTKVAFHEGQPTRHDLHISQESLLRLVEGP